MPFVTQKTPFLPPEIVLPAFVLPAILPDNIPDLKALLQAQHSVHAAAVEVAITAAVDAATHTIAREAQEYVQRMMEQLVLARHRLFGASSEQLSGQARLFDEAETLAQSTTTTQDLAPIPPATAQPGKNL